MKKQAKYQEGDWFAVPLEQGGYSLGVIARASKSGTVLGYFFGPRSLTLPTQENTIHRKADDAILIRMFGDIGIIRGEWPILFPSLSWQRDEWPLPSFGYIDRASKESAFLREYDEHDLNRMVSDTPISQEMARALPEDGLSGHIALIVRLSKLLPVHP